MDYYLWVSFEKFADQKRFVLLVFVSSCSIWGLREKIYNSLGYKFLKSWMMTPYGGTAFSSRTHWIFWSNLSNPGLFFGANRCHFNTTLVKVAYTFTKTLVPKINHKLRLSHYTLFYKLLLFITYYLTYFCRPNHKKDSLWVDLPDNWNLQFSYGPEFVDKSFDNINGNEWWRVSCWSLSKLSLLLKMKIENVLKAID